MATIRERLIYAIEVVGDGARKGIAGIKQSVAEADGAIGKFRAGANSALASVGASAGTLALAGGGALVAFGVKAVAASQDVALAAGKLHDATGLSVEDSSRLLEVAADLGISGDALTSVVKKMTVEIGKGNPLLEQYGISLQRTSDGAADVNATLLDTIKRIGAIENPTERAAAAQEAFGRGYTQAAELIFTSADQLQSKLAEVSDAKVVSPEELARAREFRDSVENLKDATEDLAVASGQLLVPALDAVAEQLGVVAEGAGEAKDAIDEIPGVPDFIKFAAQNLNPLGQQVRLYQELGKGVDFLTDKWDGAAPVSDRFNDSVLAGGDAAEGAAPAVADLGDAVGELGPRWSAATIPLEAATGAFAEMPGAVFEAKSAIDDTKPSVDDLASAFAELREKVDFIGEAFDEVFGRLDQQDLLDDITDQFDEIAEAQKKVGEDGEEGTRQYDRAVRDLRKMLLRLTEDIDSIPGYKKVQFATEIETASLDQLYLILGELTKGVTVPVSFAAPKTDAFSSLNGLFSPGTAPSAPIYNNPNPAPASNTTIIYPVGTSPTSVTVDGRIYDSRNQFGRTGIR